jgi:hypothetical protein
VAVCTFGPGVGGTDRKADPWNRERELEPRNGGESSRVPPPKSKNTSKSLATDLSYPWNRERELEPRNGAESSRIPPPKSKDT